MVDLTDDLRRAAAKAGARGNDEQQRALAAVAEALDAGIDWDWDAGEDWATIARGEGVLAWVHMCVPLVLHIEELADQLRHVADMGVVLIGVASLYDTMMRADRDVLLSAIDLPPNLPLRDFDPERFTAEDLWFYGM